MASARECTCVSKAKVGKVLETFCHTKQPSSQASQRNNFYPTGPDAWHLDLRPGGKCSPMSFVNKQNLFSGSQVLFKVSRLSRFDSIEMKSQRCFVAGEAAEGGFSRQRDLRSESQRWPESRAANLSHQGGLCSAF